MQTRIHHAPQPTRTRSTERTSVLVQPKLRVGARDDPYEHEADRIADHIMRMPAAAAPSDRPSPTPLAMTLQRKCSACDEEDKQTGVVQRDGDGAPAISTGVSAAIGDLRSTGGQPLPADLRGFFEPRFGHDFSNVRVHADTRAGEAARSLQARAFTLGRDVVFGAGEYQPQTPAGRRLLAHELTHVIQQSGGSAMIQRDVLPDATRTIDTPSQNHEHTRITRTIEQRPCDSRPTTVQTPPRQIFYWDEEARAVGMRYTICNGRVRLSAGGTVSYDNLLSSAVTLLGDALRNPTNIGSTLQRALETATIDGSGEITLTLSGTLAATISGAAQVGAQAQSYQVRGRVLVTPNQQWRFQIEGGLDLIRNNLGQQTTYTFTGQIGNENISLYLQYQQIESLPGGTGPAQIDRRFEGGFRVPLPEVRRDRCERCDCPPPLPRYQCEQVHEPHDEPVVDRQRDIQTFRLLHVYDGTAPLDQADFSQKINQIVGLLANDSHVASIRGFASPEASVRYNLALAQRRATFTHGQLTSALQLRQVSATLPSADAGGELFGESSQGRPEARNSDLADEISRRLDSLQNDDARLEQLGVDPAIRADPVRRQQAVADIQAFIRGSSNGVRLSQRARWEKIFPFLRRTEVVVDVHQRSHIQHHDGSTDPAGNCSRDQIQVAEQQMGPVPARQRLPSDRCH